MKQFILFLVLNVALIGTTFGAVQYNHKGNQSWLTFDSTTDVYFDVSRSGSNSTNENFIDRGDGISDYGWYNLDTKQSGTFNGVNVTFNEHNRIALWVKDNKNNTYISTKVSSSDYIWGKSDITDGIFKIYGGNKGSNGTHEYYVFKINTTQTSNQNTPNGQPLPGVLATLLVGGTGLWYLKNRKRLLK